MKEKPLLIKCISFNQLSKLEKNLDELVAAVRHDPAYVKNLFPEESINSQHKRSRVLLPILSLLYLLDHWKLM
jgi:hypothetical protein